MWHHIKSSAQVKQMCATCKNSGKVTRYTGKGKMRKMMLWCELRKAEVYQEDICVSYRDENGNKLYNNNLGK